MYGMVLMAAMTGAGDTTSFGDKGCGCTGSTVYAGCSGSHHHLFGGGGCHGGIFGLRHTHGCNGSAYAGCHGSVPAPVVVAAPVVAPAPVVAAAPACCPAPTCCPAPAKKHHCGLGGGLFKHKHKQCCAAPAPCAAPCAPTVVVPATTVPTPTDKKPLDKKSSGD